jgi:hypothetical protein
MKVPVPKLAGRLLYSACVFITIGDGFPKRFS